MATIDLYSASGAQRVGVYTVSGLSATTHRIKLVALGTKNSASKGSAVRFDAFDVEGHVNTLPKPTGAERAQQTDSRMILVGSWATRGPSALSNRTYSAATKVGSRVYLDFVGTEFTIYGPKLPSGGRFRVWIDGKSSGIVSTFGTARADQRALYARGGLKNVRHKVILEVLGTKEGASGGTTVALDWVEIQGHLAQARRPSPFNYPWMTYIVIDKSETKLYWVQNGYLKKVYRCAVGKPSTQTPVGIWRIGAKYYTDPGGIYGPRKMRLFRKVGSSFVYTAYNIHGTNQEWVIGTWASHGCIRMYNRQVLELFPQVPLGTMVVTKE
jgi:hypothetical protein